MSYKPKVVGHADIPPDQRIVLDHAQLAGEDYSGRKLVQFCTIGCRLERCQFVDTRIDNAQFGSGRETSEFIDCVFDGARLVGVGGYCRFVRCSFRNVDLRNWICNRTEMIDCVFTGRLRKAIFSGTVPLEFRPNAGRERNEYRGNDFSGMDLSDVTFRAGIDLTQQRMPSGPQYLYVPDAATALARAKAAIQTWPESEHRKTAMAIVNGLSDNVRDGQEQLFLRPTEWAGYGSFTQEGVERVFAVLAGTCSGSAGCGEGDVW